MKNLQNFEEFLNEKAGKPSNFYGKLSYYDQFVNGKSLSETLAKELGLELNKFGGAKDFAFDNVALYDTKTSKSIVPDALMGKYTFNELLDELKKFYKL